MDLCVVSSLQLYHGFFDFSQKCLYKIKYAIAARHRVFLRIVVSQLGQRLVRLSKVSFFAEKSL